MEQQYEMTAKRIEEVKKDLDTRISQVQDYTEGIHTAFENWSDAQDQKLSDFTERIYDKIDKLTEIISRKTEMDSALIAQIQNLSKRMEIIEVSKTGYDKNIAELNVKVDHLIQILTKHSLDKIAQDVDTAHEKLRDHEDRLIPLEQRAGKTAIKILWYLLTLAAGTASGILIAFFTNVLGKI